MGLLGNNDRLNLGAFMAWPGGPQPLASGARNKGVGWHNWIRQDGRSTILNLAAKPTGYYPPAAFSMPLMAGEMAAFVHENEGEVSAANLAGGRNGEAALSGSGTISSAVLALIVQASASLTGSGSLTADIIGLLNAAAALSGSGSLAASLNGVASILATLDGDGALTAALIADGSMSASINVTGDILTTANVAAAVWNAIIANFQQAGSTGEALQNAGAGGDPWTVVLESGFTASRLIRIIAAAAAGKSSGGPDAPVFRNVGDTQDQVTGVANDDGDRTAASFGS